ncbi:McrB family protein [Staphylococcus haemolyticus]|uniref:McrB family protein n=1 Tax=Staphylococcus haemolyticus TaxID=1283 RepID=UPI001D152721|nr:AAA family ATPase [Staphylococcus haemolyticus]MCC3665424.1 AAA family ATPase [Staphylococcus haemolyticus]
MNEELKEEIDDVLGVTANNLKAAVKLEFDILNATSLYSDFLNSNKNETSAVDFDEEFFDDEGRITGGQNKIYYGAPGTGKSYVVNSTFQNYSRVTFHPEYTYFDFVGGLRPVKGKNDSINYEFVPGIFTDMLIKAVLNKNEMNGIIIEELNRANTAAVFGDIFQLLDRDDDGKSKYLIKNKDICEYIELITNKKCEEIYLPSNFDIIATMNSADQGVFVLDSAFKRRWRFEYIPIDFNDSDIREMKISGFEMFWSDFGSTLNEFLTEIGVEEDKLIGQRFINKKEMASNDLIASKLLIYLWDDVVRYNRQKLFKEHKMFSRLITQFKEEGIGCFVDDLKERLSKVKEETEIDEI